MRRKTRIRFLLSILFFLFSLAIVINIAPRFFNINNYKGLIEKKLSDYTRTSVSIGNIQLTIKNGIELEFDDVTLSERETVTPPQGEKIFSVKKIKAIIKITPLIKKRIIVVRSLFVEGADISANRNSEGYLNISRVISNYTTPLLELKAEKKDERGREFDIKDRLIRSPLGYFLTSLHFKFIPMLRDVKIINSRITLIDRFISEKPIPVEFNNLNITVEKPLFRKLIKFQINGILTSKYQPSTFELTGTVNPVRDPALKGEAFHSNGVKDSLQNTGHMETQPNFTYPYLSNFNWGSHIKISSLPIYLFGDYFNKYLPSELSSIGNQQSGWLDIDTSIEGNLAEGFESSGDVVFRSLDLHSNLSLPYQDKKDFHGEVISDPLKPHYASIKYTMSLRRDSVNFEDIQLKVEDLLISGKCLVDEFRQGEATINLDFSIPKLDIDKGKRYLIGRIHSSEASEVFEDVIKEGELEVKSLKFSGKIGQLINLHNPSNFRLLSGVINAKNLNLDIKKGEYPLRRLNGLMTLKDGSLIFSDVTGNYGECRIINLNGSISELVSLPHIRLFIKGNADVRKAKEILLKDVPVQHKKNIDVKSGVITADIRISGHLPKHTPPLHIEADAEIKRLTISHDKIKPHFENISGFIHFTPKEIHIKKLNWNMGGAKFVVNGIVKEFKSPNPLLDINLYSRLNLPDALNLGLDKVKKLSNVEGIAEISLNLKGRKGNFIISQSLNLTDATYRYDIWLEKKKGLPNRIQFNGRINSDTLYIDNLVVLLKTAKINIKGTVNGYDDPKFVLTISTSEMDVNDAVKFLSRAEDTGASGAVSLQMNTVGHLKNIKGAKLKGKLSIRNTNFKLTYLPMPIYNLNTTVDFTGERIFIPSASGFFGDSPVSFSANVREFSNPIVEFALQSSSVNFDNIFTSNDMTGQAFPPSKAGVQLESDKKRDSQLSKITWRGNVAIDRGRLEGLSFESLMFSIYYNRDMLKVKDILFKGFGGNHIGKGWLNWDKEDGTEFFMDNKITNMNIENLYKKLPEGLRDIRGNININSKISGKGKELSDIKKSLNGNIRIEIYNGNINKFHILSKIFSLLNVYQIFKFKLPDLVTEGMPYNSIATNFEIKSGVATTEDFLIDSDSMKITAVGDIDIKVKQVDMIVGVQPFQTVDKIISSIPLAGRILTGDKKALIVFYYTVKGEMAEPKITAVPFESIGEGVLGIFKRLLLTPQKLLSPKKQSAN